MKKLIIFISMLSFTLALSSQNIKNSAKSIKNELSTQFLASDIKAPVKIAVLNFEEQSEDAKKYKLSNVISNLIAENFIKDKNFIVVEREKLENIFKELKLSALGVVDEKEIKRTGLILGVDWLVMGSISDNGSEFIIQSKIVNVETALVRAMNTTNIEKASLIKESESYYSSKYKTMFNILGGSLKSSDIKFSKIAIGAEINKNISNRFDVGFGVLKNIGDNSDFYFQKKFLDNSISVMENIVVKDNISSLTFLKLQLNYKKRLFGFDFRFGVPVGLNFIKSILEYKLENGGSAFGGYHPNSYKLPASYDKAYTSLGYGFNLSIEKSIKETFVIGFDYTYLKSSFDREFDAGPGNENLLVKTNLKNDERKIDFNISYVGIKLGFKF